MRSHEAPAHSEPHHYCRGSNLGGRCLGARPAHMRSMTSPDKMSAYRAGFGPEGGKQAGIHPADPRAPRGPALGLERGAPCGGRGGFLDPRGFESKREVMEVGGPMLWGREGRPGSPADDKGEALHFAFHLADESVAAAITQQQLSVQGTPGGRRKPFPESYASEGSVEWPGPEAGPGGGGVLALGCVKSQAASATLLQLDAFNEPWAWERLSKRGRKGQTGPPLDPNSADELGEIQLMRMSLYPKEGGQAKPSSPEVSRNTPRRSNLHLSENFSHVPGSVLSSAPRGLTSAVERQALGQLDISSAKKMQSVFWEKVGSRPSYPGAEVGTAVGAASTGGLYQATPTETVAQEKKSPEDVSKGTLGKTFPSWGQRVPAAPLEAATFPPVSGVPLPGKSKRYSLVRLFAKHSKHRGAGKNSVARRTREFELLVGRDNNPDGDPVPKGQPPTPSPGPCCLCMHRGECHIGNLDTRAPQVPGNSQPLTPIQEDIMPRGPAPSGDQEPLDVSPRPERQQQPAGAQGCCQVEPSVFVQEEQLVAVEPRSCGQVSVFLHSPGKYTHDTDVPGNAISVSELNLPEASLGHMRLNLNSVFDFPVARVWGPPPSFSQDPGLRLQYKRGLYQSPLAPLPPVCASRTRAVRLPLLRDHTSLSWSPLVPLVHPICSLSLPDAATPGKSYQSPATGPVFRSPQQLEEQLAGCLVL
ncbi:uncharacterized protein CXorf49 homolog [Manis pentadactyla]|uniref:uncharacterized protein CXorf49 homolog n=1 Tax=Manis pentadactyla TaxID=143292 RepID=UPI00255C6E68|nr:uncharacterized protein CXorf49 homolog [Manis pentadactyla]